MAIRSQTQRTLLLTFISSVVLTALIGMYTLVSGMQVQLQEQVLWTTVTIGGASILAMAAAVPLERHRWPVIGVLGIISIAVAAVMILLLIWFDIGWGFFRDDDMTYMKAMGIAIVCAVAFPHIGLISLANLRKQLELAKVATVVCIAILAGQAIVSFVVEMEDEVWYRIMGLFGIAVACGTITIPILHRYSALQKREEIRTVELQLSLVCPRCSLSQTLSSGHSKCSHCGLKFNIEIEEDQCRKCGYPLYQIQSAVCPECGTPIAITPAPALQS